MWEKWFEKLSDPIWGESCLENWYGIIELTIVWENWMTNLGDKFNVIFFGTNWCEIC